MKKKIILTIFLIILGILLIGTTKCSASGDLDEIVNYEITVDPRMNDGSLDITYQITWKVLDSTTEGPLTWVDIGTPNENFDNLTILSNNIKSASKQGSYVRIYFTKAYKAGETLTFKYKIHQSYMHTISWGKCKYEFTPAWFTNAKVDLITVKWNKEDVKKSNVKEEEDNYLVLRKANLEKGEKVKLKVEYDKKAFSGLLSYQQSKYAKNNSNRADFAIFTILPVIFLIIVMIICYIGRGGRRLLWTQRLRRRILWRVL